MANVNRRISLPVGAAILMIALAGAVLATRAGKAAGPAATPSPHTAVAGFEPSAQNVSQELMSRLHSLTKRVESDPADTASLLELARLLHDAHRPEEAVRHYTRYLELNPDNREAWFDLADVHGRSGDWPAARGVMESLLRRRPDDGAALYNLGVIEAQLDNVPAARGWWEKAAAQTGSPESAGKAREALAGLETKR